MNDKLTIEKLTAAVAGQAAAFRSVTRLQPVGGEGDRVFPVTYAGGAYATEKRALAAGETPVDCVLLDSVQSQANRAEEAIKSAIENGEMEMPLIVVDFAAANKEFRVDIPKLTSLDVPHRLADAILRDSQLADGIRFSRSKYAERWRRSTVWDATAVFELCPTALVFGLWGSPDKPGGLGAKFERAYVSEIVGVDVLKAETREGFRIDPLNANKEVKLKQKNDGSFSLSETGKLRPSEINHGNIPFSSPNGGVRFRFAEQTTVVSLGALRKLRFPVNGQESAERNRAARTVLAALGLCAGVLSSERMASLRSRCHLWPIEARAWELLDRPGEQTRYTLDAETVLHLYRDAVKAAVAAGFSWNTSPIELTPTPEFVDLVRKSQDLAASQKGEEQESKAPEANA